MNQVLSTGLEIVKHVLLLAQRSSVPPVYAILTSTPATAPSTSESLPLPWHATRLCQTLFNTCKTCPFPLYPSSNLALPWRASNSSHAHFHPCSHLHSFKSLILLGTPSVPNERTHIIGLAQSGYIWG